MGKKKCSTKQDGAGANEQVWCCIASGPSLTQEDCERVRHLNTIAVNDAYRFAPWATIKYAADAEWWSLHTEVTGRKITQDKQAHPIPDGLEVWHSVSKPGLSDEYGVIHRGGNSGYQAINVAHLMGATTIVLLGYDMQGNTHFFGKHPRTLRQCTDYSRFADAFKSIQANVINCSRSTSLHFPRVSLEDFLRAQAFTE